MFSVLDLYDKTKRAMQCGECLGIVEADEVGPQTLARPARDEADTRSALPARSERDVRQIEARMRRKEAEIDAELAALKKKMGK